MMALAQTANEFERLVTLTLSGGFSGSKQSISNPRHGRDDDHRTTRQAAPDDLRRTVNRRGIHHRGSAKLHYDHETPFQVSKFQGFTGCKVKSNINTASCAAVHFCKPLLLSPLKPKAGLNGPPVPSVPL
jgi:hypothetical protein